MTVNEPKWRDPSDIDFRKDYRPKPKEEPPVIQSESGMARQATPSLEEIPHVTGTAVEHQDSTRQFVLGKWGVIHELFSFTYLILIGVIVTSIVAGVVVWIVRLIQWPPITLMSQGAIFSLIVFALLVAYFTIRFVRRDVRLGSPEKVKQNTAANQDAGQVQPKAAGRKPSHAVVVGKESDAKLARRMVRLEAAIQKRAMMRDDITQEIIELEPRISRAASIEAEIKGVHFARMLARWRMSGAMRSVLKAAKAARKRTASLTRQLDELARDDSGAAKELKEIRAVLQIDETPSSDQTSSPSTGEARDEPSPCI